MAMDGKKFVIVFVGLIIICGVLASLWMKQAYDTRPLIKIEDVKK